MLMWEEMPQEEKERFCERWIRINRGFKSLGQSGQAKVLDRVAKMYWRELSKQVRGRLMALKIMCRILDEKDELKVAELIKELATKER